MDTQTASGSATIVESLDYEGRGVTHVDGKAAFIAGALPTELVQYQPSRKKKNFETATLLKNFARLPRADCARVSLL